MLQLEVHVRASPALTTPLKMRNLVVSASFRQRPSEAASTAPSAYRESRSSAWTAVNLGVMSRQVVESADGWAVDRGVDAVVIVEVEPARQGGPSDGFGVVAEGVGPPVGQGAVEPLQLAVGLRSVGPRAFVSDAQPQAGVAPGERAVAGAVV
jgi:hypothetical protein